MRIVDRWLGAPAAGIDPRAWTASEAWVRLALRSAAALIAILFGFGLLVSISGAVVTGGTVTVESSYATVQHLDGGIVRQILVRNGDRVRAGDVLINLDETAARANLAVVTGRINDLRIQEARLEAERARKETFEVPPEVASATTDPVIARIVKAQMAVFQARLETRRSQEQVLPQRTEQLGAQLAGLKAQHAARARERDVIATDLVSVRDLYEKGFANQQRLSALEREAARLDGEVAHLASETARIEGGIAEARLRQAQGVQAFTESVVEELRKVQAALAENEENAKTLSDRLERATVRAPRTGRVHALQVHSQGAVVTPASPIMQIIPEHERLVVEAQVMPQDIDKVRAGQPASIRFPAFDARETPRLRGEVAQVSAAELANGRGQPYFTARIEIEAGALDQLGGADRLVPGMPAEVYIETEQRSILSYFLRPLTDAMFRTFRES